MTQVKGLCVMDVDGTLIAEEVIDLLGREAGCEEEISQITSQAMRGELDFETSLRARVALLEGLPVRSLILSSNPFICPRMLKNLSPYFKRMAF